MVIIITIIIIKQTIRIAGKRFLGIWEKQEKMFNYILHNNIEIATKTFQLKLDIDFLYALLKH